MADSGSPAGRSRATRSRRLNTNSIPTGLGNAAAVRTQLSNSFGAWKHGRQRGAEHQPSRARPRSPRPPPTTRTTCMFGRTSGSSIAVTYTWQWSNGEIESDTVFNSRLPWFIAVLRGRRLRREQGALRPGQHRHPRVRAHLRAGSPGQCPLGDDVRLRLHRRDAEALAGRRRHGWDSRPLLVSSADAQDPTPPLPTRGRFILVGCRKAASSATPPAGCWRWPTMPSRRPPASRR